MENILISIEDSLQNKNWYSALILSLILPDICAKLEGSKKYSSERYPEWFNKYLGDKYSGFLSGHDCHALRCSLLHEGHSNIEERDAKEKRKTRDVLDRFVFISNGSHRIRLSNCQFGGSRYDGKDILLLSVTDFCQDMVKATKQWLDDTTVTKNLAEMLEINENGFSIGNAIKIQ